MKKQKDIPVSVRLIKEKANILKSKKKEEMLQQCRELYSEGLEESLSVVVEMMKTLDDEKLYYFDACQWYSKEFDIDLIEVTGTFYEKNRTM